MRCMAKAPSFAGAFAPSGGAAKFVKYAGRFSTHCLQRGEDMNDLEQKKPFASGSPAGLMTLAFYISFLWPLLTGRVDPSYAGAIIPLGIVVAVVQLVAGVIELRNGNLLGGTIPLAFSCFMAIGAGETALQVAGKLPADAAIIIDGHIMVVMGLLMAFLLIQAVRDPLVVFLFYLTNACFFLPLGISFLLDLPFIRPFALTSLFLIAVTAFWCGAAQLLENSLGRPVLWLGRPLVRAH